MAWSAPIERTISCFPVLHNPVTTAPNDLAIWTAKVPTPPDAPIIKTFCPGLTFPLSRIPWKAVSAAVGTEAASSNVMLDGFCINPFSGTHISSAKALQLPIPNTSSPIWNCLTLLPTTSTRPEKSSPSILCFGFRSPPVVKRINNDSPVNVCQSI